AEGLQHAALVYFSGITLSLYNAAGLDRFAAALQAAKDAGARIAMDSNYRPRGWGGDIDRARRTFERFWRLTDIGLPTHDDEQALWGDADAKTTASRLQGLGVSEVVVKLGSQGAFVADNGREQIVPAESAIKAIDTTAAGDSFNA